MKYTRIEIYSGPDRKGRYHHARFGMTDYKPGHPDGEYVRREIGQHFFSVLPDCPQARAVLARATGKGE